MSLSLSDLPGYYPITYTYPIIQAYPVAGVLPYQLVTPTNFAIPQAAESLCMNGRALNEKAVEVSPSSSRVLDRAADILTPFPPSKNRPRPGDWTCPSCGFSNFQRRTACFRCSYPINAMPPAPADMGYMHGGAYGYGPPQMMSHGHHGMGGHHGMHGHMGGGRGGGGAGNVIPFRAGDWQCGSNGCNYHNFAKNVSCLRCGASRSRALLVADSATTFSTPMNQHGNFSMGGPPGPPMEAGPPGHFGGPAGFDSTPGFPGQFGQASNYALPSGLGAASPYPPMGGQQYASNGGSGMPGPSGGFDSRTEAAFTSAGQQGGAGNVSSSGAGPGAGGNAGASSFANGAPGFEGPNDPFSFLSSGLGGLSINDSSRPGGGPPNKSPA